MDIREPSEEERDLGACSHREFLRVESSARRASLPGDTDRVGDGGDCSSRHEALPPSPHPTPPAPRIPGGTPAARESGIRPLRRPQRSADPFLTNRKGSNAARSFFSIKWEGVAGAARSRCAATVCCTLAALSRPQGIPRCPRKSWLCSSTPRGANLKTERSAALPPAVVIHCYVRRASYDTGRSQGSVRARLKKSA